MLTKTIVATFDDRDDARRARERLLDAGLHDTTLMTSEESRVREFGPSGRSSTEGASLGGAWGSMIGALAFALAASGGSGHAAIGLAVVGPLAAAAAGAIIGGAAGTIFGAWLTSGVSQGVADLAYAGVLDGKVLLAVRTHLGRAGSARAILREPEPVQ